MKVTHTYTITIEAEARHREFACGTKEHEEKQIADACQPVADACERYWQTFFDNVTVKVEATK